MRAGDPGAAPLLRRAPTTARARVPRRDAQACAPTSQRRPVAVPGRVPEEAGRDPAATWPARRPARRRSATPARASPSSPRTSRPSRRSRRCSRRSRAPRRRVNRYPDPGAGLLRRRIAERYETDPAQVAVANGSCEILLAAAMALLRAGRRARLRVALVLDVPVPRAALGRARGPGAADRRRRPRPRRDRRRDHGRHPAVAGLQPEQPDRRPTSRRTRIAEFVERVPDARDGRSSTRPTSSSSSTRTPTHRSTCAASSRTWSSCGPSARSTGSPGCASATRSCSRGVPRRGRRGAPAVQRQRARPGGGDRGDPPPGRRRRARRAQRRRARVDGRGGLRELGLDAAGSPGELLLGGPRRSRRGRGVARARRAQGGSCAPATPSAARATSASPTAPGRRTSACSTRSLAMTRPLSWPLRLAARLLSSESIDQVERCTSQAASWFRDAVLPRPTKRGAPPPRS